MYLYCVLRYPYCVIHIALSVLRYPYKHCYTLQRGGGGGGGREHCITLRGEHRGS